MDWTSSSVSRSIIGQYRNLQYWWLRVPSWNNLALSDKMCFPQIFDASYCARKNGLVSTLGVLNATILTTKLATVRPNWYTRFWNPLTVMPTRLVLNLPIPIADRHGPSLSALKGGSRNVWYAGGNQAQAYTPWSSKYIKDPYSWPYLHWQESLHCLIYIQNLIFYSVWIFSHRCDLSFTFFNNEVSSLIPQTRSAVGFSTSTWTSPGYVRTLYIPI